MGTNPLDSVGDLVSKVGDAADKNFESGEERQQQLTARHAADMASDSWLSKNVRPMTLIFLMACELAIVIGSLFGAEIDIAITSQVGTLLFGAFSWYFYSKKGERIADKQVSSNIKIAEKNAAANVEIKKMEIKELNKQNRREDRRRRREERKSESL